MQRMQKKEQDDAHNLPAHEHSQEEPMVEVRQRSLMSARTYVMSHSMRARFTARRGKGRALPGTAPMAYARSDCEVRPAMEN